MLGERRQHRSLAASLAFILSSRCCQQSQAVAGRSVSTLDVSHCTLHSSNVAFPLILHWLFWIKQRAPRAIHQMSGVAACWNHINVWWWMARSEAHEALAVAVLTPGVLCTHSAVVHGYSCRARIEEVRCACTSSSHIFPSWCQACFIQCLCTPSPVQLINLKWD